MVSTLQPQFQESTSNNKLEVDRILCGDCLTLLKTLADSSFYKEYSQIVNRFTFEFSQQYVIDGEINWNALVQFNSGKPEPKLKK